MNQGFLLISLLVLGAEDRPQHNLLTRSLIYGHISSLTLEDLGGGGVKLTPLDFFGFKFFFLDRLSKALALLFLVCEHIF